MKNFGSVIPFFLFVLLSVTAQDGYKEGFVVLNNGDTLYGKIMDRKAEPFGGLLTKIRYQGEAGKKRFASKKIQAYKRGNDLFVRLALKPSGSFFNEAYRIDSSGEFAFVKQLCTGRAIHYQIEYRDHESGYIDTIDYFRKANQPELVRVTQGVFGLKKKVLSRFFSDCPNLVKDINDKRLNLPNEVIAFYNNQCHQKP
ncbi:hypothetical protein [Sediminicola luteus]|uniref:DUF4369 domain-containing protein n=1 Tax=Sediminicola luteus TaxID=319238 RepID=A0A2A4GCH8_9FLAO|nr:hypothetical protein [Sediminicola luteus]PCE66659.1 hypothetical protein B7P33_05020 [Sediminicola luteus]